jgi:hypothetical protein
MHLKTVTLNQLPALRVDVVLTRIDSFSPDCYDGIAITMTESQLL